MSERHLLKVYKCRTQVDDELAKWNELVSRIVFVQLDEQ